MVTVDTMDADEALEEIRRLASWGRLKLSAHAADRAEERGATEWDVEHALANGVTCVPDDDKADWLVTGPDLDGDDLTAAVIIEDDELVVVFTVW